MKNYGSWNTGNNQHNRRASNKKGHHQSNSGVHSTSAAWSQLPQPIAVSGLWCASCGACFQQDDLLRIHILKCQHRNSSDTKAPKTGCVQESTATEDYALLHQTKLQLSPSPSPRPVSSYHRCNACQVVYNRADDLQVHMLTFHYKEDSMPRLPAFEEFRFEIVPVNRMLCVSDVRLGKFRGIQGENNSCYLDCSLMALFYADDTFDTLLHSPLCEASAYCDVSSTAIVGAVEYAKSYMTLHIVNGIRQRGFVPAAIMFEWRRMISQWFGGSQDFDSHCQEEEACEFVRFLMETFGDKSVRFYLTKNEDCIYSEGGQGELRKVQKASPRKLQDGENEQHFQQCEGGKQQQDRHQAHISESIPQGEVMLQLLAPSCGNTDRGQAWTTEELLNDTLHREKLSFTKLGGSLVLQVPRYGKRVRVISDVVPSTTINVSTCGPRPTKERFELRSLIVIGTSHFVSYLRVPNESGRYCTSDAANSRTWLFFDSMSDRVDEQNIPLLENVTNQVQLLEFPNAHVQVRDEIHRPGREHLRRIVQDLSIAIYRRV